MRNQSGVPVAGIVDIMILNAVLEASVVSLVSYCFMYDAFGMGSRSSL